MRRTGPVKRASMYKSAASSHLNNLIVPLVDTDSIVSWGGEEGRVNKGGGGQSENVSD